MKKTYQPVLDTVARVLGHGKGEKKGAIMSKEAASAIATHLKECGLNASLEKLREYEKQKDRKATPESSILLQCRAVCVFIDTENHPAPLRNAVNQLVKDGITSRAQFKNEVNTDPSKIIIDFVNGDAELASDFTAKLEECSFGSGYDESAAFSDLDGGCLPPPEAGGLKMSVETFSNLRKIVSGLCRTI